MVQIIIKYFHLFSVKIISHSTYLVNKQSNINRIDVLEYIYAIFNIVNL